MFFLYILEKNLKKMYNKNIKVSNGMENNGKD